MRFPQLALASIKSQLICPPYGTLGNPRRDVGNCTKFPQSTTSFPLSSHQQYISINLFSHLLNFILFTYITLRDSLSLTPKPKNY